MKKNINLDDILDYIAVEKAPEDLIYKWKTELEIQKEKKTLFAVFLRPSIVFSLIFAGLWYYFFIFNKAIFKYNFVAKARSLLVEISPAAAGDSISAVVSSNYYIIGVSIFSLMLAAVSLFWFYQGRKLRYSIVRNW